MKFTSFVTASLALFCLTLSLNATPLRSYDASQNSAPSAQGWTGNGGITSGANVTDLGLPSWRMTGDNCCGFWFSSLTTTELNQAFAAGWSFGALTRYAGDTSGFAYLMLDVPNASLFPRFDLVFGFDGTNYWAGLSDWFDAANPALKVNLPDGGYHYLEMRYDPVSQTVSLWVDGAQALSGYTGHNEFRQNHGPAFGVTGNTQDAYFAQVSFTPTPEPGTWALVLAGLAAASRLRRRLLLH